MSNKNSTGSIWIGSASTQVQTAFVLCDASAIGMPPEGDGFKYRLLFLSFAVVAIDSDYAQDKDVEAFLPGGAKDRFLAGNTSQGINGEGEGINWARSTGVVQMEALYAGPGQSAYESDLYMRKLVWDNPLGTGTKVIVYFWVDATSGDLMCAWKREGGGESPLPAEIALHGVVFYGPVWASAE